MTEQLMRSLQECAERLHEMDRRVTRLERLLYILIGLAVGTGAISVWEVLG